MENEYDLIRQKQSEGLAYSDNYIIKKVKTERPKIMTAPQPKPNK